MKLLVAIPAFLRVPLISLLIVASTVLHTTPLLVVALIKALVPVQRLQREFNRVLITLAEAWIGVNSWMIDHFTSTVIDANGPETLRLDGHYLVLSNHQSWVDILVLQKLFNRRIPFLRFFLKKELIWVPFLGLAWWALDFPFMERYSKQTLARHPEWAGKDTAATRKACEKFRGMPVSVMNFVEGTRCTAIKQAQQDSPFRHLLRPRAGGVAFVLDAMGSGLNCILDISIFYPGGAPTLFDLIGNRIPAVSVKVRELAIPAGFLAGNYEGDPIFRGNFQQWINLLWLDKDKMLADMKAGQG